NVVGSSKCCSRIAVYRTENDEFVEYKFKAFRYSEITLVKEITKSDISLIIGHFAFADSNNTVDLPREETQPTCTTAQDEKIAEDHNLNEEHTNQSEDNMSKDSEAN
ncbi:9608_t:CDS:2, partial [Racocetra persica]